jgi:hypothetical protein
MQLRLSCQLAKFIPLVGLSNLTSREDTTLTIHSDLGTLYKLQAREKFKQAQMTSGSTCLSEYFQLIHKVRNCIICSYSVEDLRYISPSACYTCRTAYGIYATDLPQC